MLFNSDLASVYQEVSKLVIRDFFNKRRQKSQKDPSLEVYDEKDRIYLLRAFATLSLHCRLANYSWHLFIRRL